MKQLYLISSIPALLFLLNITQLTAQTTCDDPLVIINDDVEGYTLGDITDQVAHWDRWPGATVGGIVSDEQAQSGTQSIKIDGTSTDQDVLLLLGDQNSGHFYIRFNMYIDSSKNAHFNIQHIMPTTTEGFWGANINFEDGGNGNVDLFDDSENTFNFPQDAWFQVILFADINNDQARLIIDDKIVAAWTFSNGITNDDTPNPSNNLNSLNFFADDDSFLFYLDDIEYWQIPEAGTGQYCYTAVEIQPGIHEVPDLTCFGGGYDLGGDNVGLGAFWFKYTPTEDGRISMASCGGGFDTRGWIFLGDCQQLGTVGVNDDQCEISPGGQQLGFLPGSHRQCRQYLLYYVG